MQRILLDEGFPDPPGFDPATLQGDLEVTPLRRLDRSLVGARTPDWYLYLLADEQGFDTLVTRDWRQSQQPEEMWALTRTSLSIVTWRRPQEDPVVEWAQLLAYLPQLRRLRREVGAAVFFIPHTQLNARQHVGTASRALHDLAKAEGRSRQQVTEEARASITGWLEQRELLQRYSGQLGL